jgi:ABC-type sulfate transport system substrate-binding protein
MAYLAAWTYARKKGQTDAQAAEFVAKLFKNVPVLAKVAAMQPLSFCNAILAMCW